MRRKWKIWMREMKKDIQVVPKRAEGGSFMRISHRKTLRVECVQNHQPTHSPNNFIVHTLKPFRLVVFWKWLVVFPFCVVGVFPMVLCRTMSWSGWDEMIQCQVMRFFRQVDPLRRWCQKYRDILSNMVPNTKFPWENAEKKHTPTNKPKKESWKCGWNMVKHSET